MIHITEMALRIKERRMQRELQQTMLRQAMLVEEATMAGCINHAPKTISQHKVTPIRWRDTNNGG